MFQNTNQITVEDSPNEVVLTSNTHGQIPAANFTLQTS
jgi:hypothetical protein